jgi:hypothetical protein
MTTTAGHSFYIGPIGFFLLPGERYRLLRASGFILVFDYIDLLFNTLKTSFYELFLILRELISKYRHQR